MILLTCESSFSISSALASQLFQLLFVRDSAPVSVLAVEADLIVPPLRLDPVRSRAEEAGVGEGGPLLWLWDVEGDDGFVEAKMFCILGVRTWGCECDCDCDCEGDCVLSSGAEMSNGMLPRALRFLPPPGLPDTVPQPSTLPHPLVVAVPSSTPLLGLAAVLRADVLGSALDVAGDDMLPQRLAKAAPRVLLFGLDLMGGVWVAVDPCEEEGVDGMAS